MVSGYDKHPTGYEPPLGRAIVAAIVVILLAGSLGWLLG